MNTQYNGHTYCHKCGQTHWMHGCCHPPIAETTAEARTMPQVSTAMQRKMIVFRRKRWVMKQLERLPFFSA